MFYTPLPTHLKMLVRGKPSPSTACSACARGATHTGGNTRALTHALTHTQAHTTQTAQLPCSFPPRALQHELVSGTPSQRTNSDTTLPPSLQHARTHARTRALHQTLHPTPCLPHPVSIPPCQPVTHQPLGLGVQQGVEDAPVVGRHPKVICSTVRQIRSTTGRRVLAGR